MLLFEELIADVNRHKRNHSLFGDRNTRNNRYKRM